MINKELKGVIPPLVTPFTSDEKLDEAALIEEANFLIKAGVHGLSFGGSTGEGAILSNQEIALGTRIVKAQLPDSIPLLCGIIRNSTRDAIKTALIAKASGAEILMITPTYYFGPEDNGNYEFYNALAKEVGLPIIIYNVIKDNAVSVELMKKISEIELIIGVKQSCGGIHALNDMIAACGDKLLVFSAQDDLLFAGYLLGAKGSISAIDTVFPKLCVQQWQAVQSGDLELARNIHFHLLPVWKAIEGKAFPGKIKAALNLMGRRVGQARRPGGATAPVITEIEKKLIEAQLL